MKPKELKKGIYVADFRFDEGLRIRDEFVSPCLNSKSGGGFSREIFLLIVDEDQRSNEKRMDGSE